MASDVGIDLEAATTSPWQTSRETLGWIAWTVLADVLIFRSWGMTGPATLLAIVPVLFFVFGRSFGRPAIAVFCCGVLWLVSARLIWAGGALATMVGFAFVAALAMAAAGAIPWVMETFWLGVRSPVDGMIRMTEKRVRLGTATESPKRFGLAIAVLFPLAAAVAFGSIFVLANPDLHDWVRIRLESLGNRFWDFFHDLSFWEIPFCITALFISAGLMRPRQWGAAFVARDVSAEIEAPSSRSVLYEAFRNTLLTVIVLFAAYLHPSVMIAVKSIDDEGIFPLLGLANSPDTIIREGVRAMLAERQLAIETWSADGPWHWTCYRGSADWLYRELAKQQQHWENYRQSPSERAAAIARFQDYAMRWY